MPAHVCRALLANELVAYTPQVHLDAVNVLVANGGVVSRQSAQARLILLAAFIFTPALARRGLAGF